MGITPLKLIEIPVGFLGCQVNFLSVPSSDTDDALDKGAGDAKYKSVLGQSKTKAYTDPLLAVYLINNNYTVLSMC